MFYPLSPRDKLQLLLEDPKISKTRIMGLFPDIESLLERTPQEESLSHSCSLHQDPALLCAIVSGTWSPLQVTPTKCHE